MDAGGVTDEENLSEPKLVGAKSSAPKAAAKKMTPEMLAEHKAMMDGVPGAKASSPDDHQYKVRGAYRKAFEDHVTNFLEGNLKDAQGETVQHREEALHHAHLAGLKAVQGLKKSGLKLRVFAD